MQPQGYEYARSLIEASLDPMIVINTEGIITDLNEALVNVTHKSREQLKGTPFERYFANPEKAREVYRNVLEHGFVINYPLTLIDGVLTDILFNGSVYKDENGNVLGAVIFSRDITEKKRIEKTLEIERQRFHDLVFQAPSCMGLLKGPHHEFRITNPLYLELTGKTDIIGKTVEQVFPETIEQGFLEILDNVYRTGKTFFANEMCIRLNKNNNRKLTEIFVNFIYQAYKNEIGEIEGVFFFAVDVTEQVLSRKRIEESEKQYRQIAETAQEGIWLIDQKNKTIFVNKKFSEIFGYSFEEMIGKASRDLMDEDGKMIGKEKINRSQKSISEEFEQIFLSKTSQRIWAKVSVSSILDHNGNYNGALAMLSDITERKTVEKNLRKSEIKLKEAQELAHISNWEIDLITNVNFWSDEFYNIFGFTKEQIKPSLEVFMSLIHPDDYVFAKKSIEKTFETLKEGAFEVSIKKKDGTVRQVFTKWKFEFDQTNKPIRLFGTLQDVTDRKNTEAEHEKMINEIILRSKNLEQFTYIISHNLRAPVANILGLSTILRGDITETERKTIYEYLCSAVDHLDDIIKDLHKILQAKSEIINSKESVYFHELVSAIKVSLHHVIQKENVTIITDFTNVDKIVIVKSYIYSIFYNLIANSIKYRQADIETIIKITTKEDKDHVRILFKDNGLGINLKENGDNLFGLYKRFHPHIEGKGLGLFMVKTQIEVFGGKISVKSEPNIGTEFTIELPYK